MSELMAAASPSSLSKQECCSCASAKSAAEDLLLNAPEYMTDEFRMWHFKIDKCPRLHAHDWTTCPLAHDGEKARRRDPEKFRYAAIACIDMKNNGHCPRGDSCPYAHNVFEYWMHPTRYRTQVCNDGTKCKRQICFFAHRLEELRIPPRKPGFPPEWNKGRKHKNRSSNAKKKMSGPQNDAGMKACSDPVVNFGLGPGRRVAESKKSMKESLPRTPYHGSAHRLTLGNVMQDPGSVRQQSDAVPFPSVPYAAGHTIYGIKQPFSQQQHHAVQSDIQTSRGLQYYANRLEKALYCPGADFSSKQNKEHTSDFDGYLPVQQGDLYGLGRMNPSLLSEVSSGCDALSASYVNGSPLTSPEASHVQSQNIAPFPGMGSDLSSPVTPHWMEHSPLRIDEGSMNFSSFGPQRLTVPDYSSRPYAY